MNIKIIGMAAICGLMGASMAAQADGFLVYGRLDANLESVRNDKATAVTSQNRMMSNASRFGVRGSKDLGDGLSAIYQAEAGFDLNGAAGNGLGSSRNSQVGLTGDLGTAFLGNWDTPYFMAHDPVEQFGNTTIATGVNLTGRVANGATIANFNNHQINVVQYWSPVWAGVQVKAAYAPDNNKTATTDKDVFSLSATYDAGMLYGAYAFESHRDASFSGQSDRANRVVGAVKTTNALLSLTYENISVGTSTNTSASRTGIELSGRYAWGSSHIGVAYSQAGDLGGVTGTGASQYSVRYGRNLGSDTEIYGFYTSLSNRAAATYNFKDGPIAGGAGAKLSGFGVGVAQNF